AQTTPYNVVFDLTSKDTNDHKTVIRWLNGISKERPEAKLEVVLYGQSLDFVQKDKSVDAAALQNLLQNKNITFKVCAAAMKRHNVDAASLLPGVEPVPDGIYQIITRQGQGWGYIKVAK
ncbi:MAG TPA: DsrE family protein, partial [Chitinophagaceae bacterium]